ncbi:hypothetical protein MXB_2501, partial [Myxobolus squamalis]
YQFNQKIQNGTLYYKCIIWREHGCTARLIVKGDKNELRKIHECQRFKKRVEITSTPVVVYINQLSCNFIKQAASDFINLLYGPPIKAFRTYGVRAIYYWTQHSKSCYLFYQCLTLLTFDSATRLFITCMYVLMTAKTEYIYYSVLHELVVLLNYWLMPKIITADFEKALVSAVKHEFPWSQIIGCHFHLLQVMNHKMIKYRIMES